MAERVKLQEPGSELVMSISSVTPQTVEQNDYYLFGNGKVELLVPQSSVKAQLERLDIKAVEQMVGKIVRFSRSTKMSRANKPFWNIDWAGHDPRSGAEALSQQKAGGEGNAGNPVSAPPAEPAPVERQKLSDIYLKATEFVIDKVVPKYTAAGIGCSDTAIVAAVATLFIAASKER